MINDLAPCGRRLRDRAWSRFDAVCLQNTREMRDALEKAGHGRVHSIALTRVQVDKRPRQLAQLP